MYKENVKNSVMLDNTANNNLYNLIHMIDRSPTYISSPRGMKCKELIGASYENNLIAAVTDNARKVNKGFMFAEAAWILSGSNRLSYLKKYMKSYEKYSDDGVFMNGAYGPKVVDQLPYVVSKLAEDQYSRQAYLNIWREKPGPSADIPCTTSMQFFIRENRLHQLVNMRSQDIFLGYTYDVFTFSMIALGLKKLLEEKGFFLKLGIQQVNVGSLHLYDFYDDKITEYMKADQDIDNSLETTIGYLTNCSSYDNLIDLLKMEADYYSRNK